MSWLSVRPWMQANAGPFPASCSTPRKGPNSTGLALIQRRPLRISSQFPQIQAQLLDGGFVFRDLAAFGLKHSRGGLGDEGLILELLPDPGDQAAKAADLLVDALALQLQIQEPFQRQVDIDGAGNGRGGSPGLLGLGGDRENLDLAQGLKQGLLGTQEAPDGFV